MARGQFHKEEIFSRFSKNVSNPLMCERKNQPFVATRSSESDANNVVKSCEFKPNMAENNEQPYVHEFKIFDIVQDVNMYEFLRPLMAFVAQNLFRICGSHQNLILIKWLMSQHCLENIHS